MTQGGYRTQNRWPWCITSPTVEFPTQVIGFFFFLLASHWVFVTISSFFSFILTGAFLLISSWNWKFVELKFETVLLNVFYTPREKAHATWEMRLVKRMSKGNIPILSRSHSMWKLCLGMGRHRFLFKSAEVPLKCQLYSAQLVTFYFSVLSLLQNLKLLFTSTALLFFWSSSILCWYCEMSRQLMVMIN